MEIRDTLFEAGRLLKSRYQETQKYSEKERFHLVSEVDLEVEQLLIKGLRLAYADDAIWSEETGHSGGSSNTRWIIDPIDGTANFIAGIPYFAISVAREIEGRITEGYVYNPVAEEYYYSTTSLGTSFLNDKPICVSRTGDIREALLAFGFSANMPAIQEYYGQWRALFENCKKGLALIVPSLTICNVARGRLDGFIDFGCSMQGHAAASLILTYAGGEILNYDMTAFDHRVKGAVASNLGLMSVFKQCN